MAGWLSLRTRPKNQNHYARTTPNDWTRPLLFNHDHDAGTNQYELS